jgi:hypothetical protein
MTAAPLLHELLAPELAKKQSSNQLLLLQSQNTIPTETKELKQRIWQPRTTVVAPADVFHACMGVCCEGNEGRLHA